MFEAREFLRKRLIGKKVQVRWTMFKQPIKDFRNACVAPCSLEARM